MEQQVAVLWQAVFHESLSILVEQGTDNVVVELLGRSPRDLVPQTLMVRVLQKADLLIIGTRPVLQ